MACAVLGRRLGVVFLLLVACCGVFAAGAVAQGMACSPKDLGALPEDRQKAIVDLQKHVEAGPLFQSLKQWRKPGSGCEMKLDGESVTFSYTFADRVSFEARNDASVEYSEQTVRVPRMRADRALALLKKSELDAMGATGCGIDWEKPVTSSTAGGRESLFVGSSCNCQARLIYRGKFVVGLVLKSSC